MSDRQGYTYCPSDPGSCAGSAVSAYFPQLDLARQHGFINRTVIALGWMLGRSALNPGGWTAGSLRAAMTTLKQRYPESEPRTFLVCPPPRVLTDPDALPVPGMMLYGWPPGNGRDARHVPSYNDTATIDVMKAAARLLKELYPDPT